MIRPKISIDRAIASACPCGVSSAIRMPASTCARARFSSASVSSSAAPLRRVAGARSSASVARALSAAQVDGEQAGVGEALGPGIDRIGQAALLAQLLEQPRRHAAADRLGEQRQGRRGRIGRRQAGIGQGEMRLLGRAAVGADAADEAGARDRRRRACVSRSPNSASASSRTWPGSTLPAAEITSRSGRYCSSSQCDAVGAGRGRECSSHCRAPGGPAAGRRTRRRTDGRGSGRRAHRGIRQAPTG